MVLSYVPMPTSVLFLFIMAIGVSCFIFFVNFIALPCINFATFLLSTLMEVRCFMSVFGG